MTPIWKDYDVLLDLYSPASPLAFMVEAERDGLYQTLYYGHNYLRPGDAVNTVRINDIVATELTRGLSFLGETDNPFVEVLVSQEEPGDGSFHNVVEEGFFADWSYDPDFNYLTDALNVPICPLLVPGQMVPHTYHNDVINVPFTITQSSEDTGQYNDDFNLDFAIMGEETVIEHIPNGGAFQTAWLDLGDYPTASAVVTGPNSYKVVCGQYALYYVNAYGGWDTMAILGKVKREDGVTHHTTDQLYKNTKTSNRGRVNYVNELTTKFTFYTHYLTNEQSARMHHLLNSPTVYLHDVAKGHVWPIVLTGNSNERKQNGLQQYAIEAELAQNRIRR